jgi:hypothetical protein
MVGLLVRHGLIIPQVNIKQAPQRKMNAPTKKRVFVSPTSVIQEARIQWVSVPEVPDIFLYHPQHQVRFSDQVSRINNNCSNDYLTEELLQELWFSRQEIQDFHKEAKQQAKDFREQHSQLAQELGTLARRCTQEESSSSLQAIFRSPRAQQIMKCVPGTTVRGLEGHLHVIVGRNRVLHRQGLLALQNCCPTKHQHDTELLEQLLQSRSLTTSRASRALARLLAHGDYLHMADMIRQELRESNEDILVLD